MFFWLTLILAKYIRLNMNETIELGLSWILCFDVIECFWYFVSHLWFIMFWHTLRVLQNETRWNFVRTLHIFHKLKFCNGRPPALTNSNILGLGNKSKFRFPSRTSTTSTSNSSTSRNYAAVAMPFGCGVSFSILLAQCSNNVDDGL